MLVTTAEGGMTCGGFYASPSAAERDVASPGSTDIVATNERTPGGVKTGRLIPAELKYPNTPDGRYIVVRGRLWRCSNPDLTQDVREALTRELMSARERKGRRNASQ